MFFNCCYSSVECCGKYELRGTVRSFLNICESSGDEFFREFISCVQFLSPDDTIKFYENYAQMDGFNVRFNTTINSDGVVKLKHLLCHRQGFKRRKTKVDTQKNPNSNQSNRKETRCGCEAKLYFKLVNGGMYSGNVFDENHNHHLASTFGKQFLMQNRHLSIDKQNFILGHMRIGATRVFRLVKEMVGGYSNIGATLIDFKIFKRDIKTFIGGCDVEMFVNHLKNKRDCFKGYVFEYVADEEGTLTRLFWAYSMSANDREIFVDVVSFDATYSTNKYNMIFVPFTGIDNHKKGVTFAAALLSSEDVESYTWILECFKKCIGRAPQIVLTDQYPALRVVVPKVMIDAHHRYFIWHIMKKLSVKLPDLPAWKSRSLLKTLAAPESPSFRRPPLHPPSPSPPHTVHYSHGYGERAS
ncbi:hypothetical protein QQ045_015698 [Rhodiola kirilowii]